IMTSFPIRNISHFGDLPWLMSNIKLELKREYASIRKSFLNPHKRTSLSYYQKCFAYNFYGQSGMYIPGLSYYRAFSILYFREYPNFSRHGRGVHSVYLALGDHHSSDL